MGDYNIPNKTKTDLFLQSFEPSLVATLAKYNGTIGTLAYCQNVKVTENPPAGCAILTCSDKVSLFTSLWASFSNHSSIIEEITNTSFFLSGKSSKLEHSKVLFFTSVLSCNIRFSLLHGFTHIHFPI